MEPLGTNHPGELSTEPKAAECRRDDEELGARAEALQVLTGSQIQFLVGGAYAYGAYTSIYRDTKDLDIFLRRKDARLALHVLAKQGWRTERTDEGWIYKAFRDEWYVDLIFCSANGVGDVDDGWFEGAPASEVLGCQVRLVPPEEMIWSKAFVLERDRYDGADVVHLIKSCSPTLDWDWLLRRFGPHWEVLLTHLILFRYAYPGERSHVPARVMNELIEHLLQTVRAGDEPTRICRGTLLSRYNYVLDVEKWGYLSARTGGAMSE